MVRRLYLVLAVLFISVSPAAIALSAGSHAHHAPVSTINGKALPVDMLPLQDRTVMLDTIDSNGNRLYIVKGTRKAGTRAAIHIHRFGGHTCVLSGEITIFIEGSEPLKRPAGTCYFMPPNTPMSAVNLGTEDAELIDAFTLPPGQNEVTRLEDYTGAVSDITVHHPLAE